MKRYANPFILNERYQVFVRDGSMGRSIEVRPAESEENFQSMLTEQMNGLGLVATCLVDLSPVWKGVQVFFMPHVESLDFALNSMKYHLVFSLVDDELVAHFVPDFPRNRNGFCKVKLPLLETI